MDEPIYEYDREITACLAGFEHLWQRVSGNTPSARSEDRTLQHLIREECCVAGYYTALARMFQGSGRAQLLNQAGEARRHARRLRAEYFILTGLSCDAPKDCPSVSGKLASLRSALTTEQNLAAAYAQAAEATECPVLREAYRCFAQEASGRAAANRTLLLECF